MKFGTVVDRTKGTVDERQPQTRMTKVKVYQNHTASICQIQSDSFIIMIVCVHSYDMNFKNES